MLKAKLLTICASTLFMGASAQTPKFGVDPIEKVINAMPTDEKIQATLVLEINKDHDIVKKIKEL